METRITDPVTNFRFIVNSSQWARAGFSKVSGLKEESDVIEYREGIDPAYLQKFPGLRKFPEVTFERGLTRECKGLIQWRNAVIQCRPGYKSFVTVDVQTCPGVAARTINLPAAWPSALEISDLDAKASEIAIETMTLQHEAFTDKAVNASIFSPF